MEPQDTITVAPSVLITIAQQAATQIKGVARMGTIPVSMGRLFSGQPMGNGIVLKIDDSSVIADVYLVVIPDVNIRDVSHEVQRAITRSMAELVGMDVVAVNVHIEDVDYETPAAGS